jgi:hypothetical protein
MAGVAILDANGNLVSTTPDVNPFPNGLGIIPLNANGSPQTVPQTNPVQSTGLPTPNNVQNNPAQSTVLTSAGGLLSEVGAIIASPSQHIFGVIVLVAIAWFIWKHR